MTMRSISGVFLATTAALVLSVGCGGGTSPSQSAEPAPSEAPSYTKSELSAKIGSCLRDPLMEPFAGTLEFHGTELMSGGTLGWTVYEDFISPPQIAAVILFQSSDDAVDAAAQNESRVVARSQGSPWGIFGPEKVDDSSPDAASVAFIEPLLTTLESCLARSTDSERIPTELMSASG